MGKTVSVEMDSLAVEDDFDGDPTDHVKMATADGVKILGRHEGRIVAESDGMRYYLTDCCHASGKGAMYEEDCPMVVCRKCYREVAWEYGDLVPDDAKIEEAPEFWR